MIPVGCLFAKCFRWTVFLPSVSGGQSFCQVFLVGSLFAKCFQWAVFLPRVSGEQSFCHVFPVDSLFATCFRWSVFLPRVSGGKSFCHVFSVDNSDQRQYYFINKYITFNPNARGHASHLIPQGVLDQKSGQEMNKKTGAFLRKIIKL